MAERRLSLTAQGKVRYRLKTPYRDGTTHVIFEPLDFIAKLAALVPRPRVNLTRYHGLFAPNSHHRAQVTPGRRSSGKPAPAESPEAAPDERRLVNTSAVRQYEGLKQTDDRHDAFWLAHLMRLRILPTGYIYPRPLRWVRDLLRKRLALVQDRTRHLLSLESRWARHTGEVLSVKSLRDRLGDLKWGDACIDLAIDSDRQLIEVLDTQIKRIETQIREMVKPRLIPDLLGCCEHTSAIHRAFLQTSSRGSQILWVSSGSSSRSARRRA